MSKVVCQQLQGINLKALLLSEEARGVANLFDNFAYQSELNSNAVMSDADQEKGMYCLIRGMARHFETEFEKIAKEVEEAQSGVWRKPKAKKVTKEVVDGEEGKA